MRLDPLHGYRLVQATGRSPVLPFGFGLSYTTFEHGRLVAKRTWDGTVRLTVPVVNTGTRQGDEVVQVYVDEALGSDPPAAHAARPCAGSRAPRRHGERHLRVGARRAGPSPRHGGKVRLHVGRDADPAGHRTAEV